MPPPWIEHGTFCLQGKRSTTELQRLLYIYILYFFSAFKRILNFNECIIHYYCIIPDIG